MDTEPYIEVQQLDEKEKNGYDMYRVPGIVVTETGTVLVYYDGRRKINGQPVQSLLMKRSTDQGKTWQQRLVLIEGKPGEQIHNALMIAGKNDEVHFFWNVSYTRCFYKKSYDAGLTWSDARELTSVFEEYRKVYPWVVFAVAPGHGIMLRSGRLMIPAWMSTSTAHHPACFTCIYSDDDGQTWNCGAIFNDSKAIDSPTEGAIAELEDGRVMATVRHGTAGIHKRAFTVGDGVSMWGPVYFHEDLPDPICAGSICRYCYKEQKGFDGLLFANCAWEDTAAIIAKQNGSDMKWSDDARRNLTIRLSEDGGYTWRYSSLLEPYGGYSDLAVSPDKQTIYCVYENGWIDGQCIFTKRISIARFNIAWLKR